jgi:hypothetical protein
MICPYCKGLIRDDSFSCGHCGSYVRDRTARSAPDSRQHVSAFEREVEDPAQRAGEQGEEWLLSILGTYSRSRKGHLFVGKRIPAGARRREIDLIAVTTKRLYIFEAKNWSGAVSLEGNSWIQIRRNGERVINDNLLESTRSQAQALLQYLKTKDIVIPDIHVSHKVFFIKQRLEIDPAIAKHPDVLYPSKLAYPINHETIIDYCLAQERSDPLLRGLFEAETRRLFPRIVDEIYQLRTWDRIFTDGQDAHRGDVKQITLGNDVLLPDDLPPGLKLDVQWSGDESERLLKNLLGVKPGMLVFSDDVKLPIGIDDTVLFHKVGARAPTLLPLTQIKKITIG